MMKIIQHSRPTVGKEEMSAVQRVVKSAYLSMGQEVASLEKEMASRLKMKGAAAVSSGTAALHLALAGLKIGPGDEVILPTYVCTALLNAVHYVGAKPVLADVRLADGNIDPRDVAQRINPRTRAIIVPHMFGFPADIKALLELGVPLIEDCAQSAGALIGKKPVGSFGRVSVFSFYATKMMACGEGGMLASSDEAVLAEARTLLEYDHQPEYRVRFNYKMTDLQASLGRVQLKRLPSMVKARQKIAAAYCKALGRAPVELPAVPKGVTPSFYRFVIRVKDPAAVIAAMKKQGIMAERPLFKPLHDYLGLSGYPSADRLKQESVSLPIYPSLSRQEFEKIKKSLLGVLDKLG